MKKGLIPLGLILAGIAAYLLMERPPRPGGPSPATNEEGYLIGPDYITEVVPGEVLYHGVGGWTQSILEQPGTETWICNDRLHPENPSLSWECDPEHPENLAPRLVTLPIGQGPPVCGCPNLTRRVA